MDERDLPDSFDATMLVVAGGDAGVDLAELGLDALLDNGDLLEQLPIVKSIISVGKTGMAVRDWLLTKKILTFLDQTTEIPPMKRQAILRSLDDPRTKERAAERLLVVLDRLDSVTKARLIGRLFQAVVSEAIDHQEFWRMTFVIDHVPIEDLAALENWRNLDLRTDVPHPRKHVYLGVGLGWFVSDMSSSGFRWEERLCGIVSDNLLSE